MGGGAEPLAAAVLRAADQERAGGEDQEGAARVSQPLPFAWFFHQRLRF